MAVSRFPMALASVSPLITKSLELTRSYIARWAATPTIEIQVVPNGIRWFRIPILPIRETKPRPIFGRVSLLERDQKRINLTQRPSAQRLRVAMRAWRKGAKVKTKTGTAAKVFLFALIRVHSRFLLCF